MKKVISPAIVRRLTSGLLALAVLAVLIWFDVNTTIWQERVILAGVAGSLATFLLTYIVMNILLHRMRERRWAPVTGLALTDLLHALADEAQSEVSRGRVVPHSMRIPDLLEVAEHFDPQQWDQLLKLVLTERDLLTRRLAAWSPFLASSSDNDQILQHIASASLQLDAIRDAIIEAETHHLADPALEAEKVEAATRDVHVQIHEYNQYLKNLVEEIAERLRDFQVATA